jgi:hypothetical protein
MSIRRTTTSSAATELPPVFVLHRSVGADTCRHCHHPIRLYGDVGWVDTTPAFYGGCYDMCSRAVSGQHEPG